ncbi:MAG: tetraprenyl-beta-curcumene synthase family protein [Negativicutes bacterium]|nr:tetraprenyl-beta-curcumene synthase family protein [Negativicutes bacterium]
MVSLMERASSLGLITKFVRQVFPLVDTELAFWQQHASRHCPPDLAAQALASIRDKKFHCQGGSIYCLYPGVTTHTFVRLVVALQTISDYLDNLCDRAGIADEAAFRQLHLAMTDALDPSAGLHDYYRYYPSRDDGGYLAALVTACQEEISRLPAYPVVKPMILDLARLYSDLQTYKHLDPAIREQKMHAWAQQRSADYPQLTLWEFAAASGSTLGMFMLCAAAADPGLTAAAADKTRSAYFPWICGFHILLDYFIDMAEDRSHGDLNFVAYYGDEAETLSRLTHFWQQALFSARELPHPLFSETIVQGLLAMYLSDPKTSACPERAIKTSLLADAGSYTRLVYALCRLLRRRQAL